MAGSIPDRIRAAVESLEIRPTDRVLEIGAGPGVSVDLVAQRLRGGTITAIDRSAVAVERALGRNEAHVAAGRAVIRHLSLEELEPEGERYDKVFAIDVNLFWTRAAGPELELIRSRLRPGGSLHLFYDGVAAEARSESIVATLVEQLAAHGLTARALEPPLIGVVARPGATA
jgi:cyclopropane fatty-acyl-phospholipid synthase-like methyltransferase